ncbi:hypothetical protein RB195_022346 [Necator americanus]|uniref:Protein kinase domain-containing protein n=1 Tax=Necator americanus TaxID=51031 RepID=A0ABR1EEY1_NECAM
MRDVKSRRLWSRDEWMDAVRTPAVDKEGFAELWLRTTSLSEEPPIKPRSLFHKKPKAGVLKCILILPKVVCALYKSKIIQLVEHFDYHGHCCLVFKLYGLSVFDFQRKYNFRPYHIDDTRHIMYQICYAVKFLHDNKLTHTDLKPENVLFVCDDSYTEKFGNVIFSTLLLRSKNNPFLDRLVTWVEKQIIYNKGKRSAQWMDEDEVPKHFPKSKMHPKKTMVTLW